MKILIKACKFVFVCLRGLESGAFKLFRNNIRVETTSCIVKFITIPTQEKPEMIYGDWRAMLYVLVS